MSSNIILEQQRPDLLEFGYLGSVVQAKAGVEISQSDWLREKLARSARGTQVRVPHGQVMDDAQALIYQKTKPMQNRSPIECIEDADPTLEWFLQFLEQQMSQQLSLIEPVDQAQLARIAALVNGVDTAD